MQKYRNKSTIGIILSLLILVSQPAMANYNAMKIGDWKYRAYVCNTAIAYLVYFSSIEVDGKPETIIDTHSEKAEAEEIVVEEILNPKTSVIKSTFSFDRGDAQWTGLMTTMIRDALLLMYPNKKLDALTINRNGFDLCVRVFNKGDEHIKKNGLE